MAKPKSKTQKRIDHNIRLALTDACEQFLENIPGFQWLTQPIKLTTVIFPAAF